MVRARCTIDRRDRHSFWFCVTSTVDRFARRRLARVKVVLLVTLSRKGNPEEDETKVKPHIPTGKQKLSAVS